MATAKLPFGSQSASGTAITNITRSKPTRDDTPNPYAQGRMDATERPSGRMAGPLVYRGPSRQLAYDDIPTVTIAANGEQPKSLDNSGHWYQNVARAVAIQYSQETANSRAQWDAHADQINAAEGREGEKQISGFNAYQRAHHGKFIAEIRQSHGANSQLAAQKLRDVSDAVDRPLGSTSNAWRETAPPTNQPIPDQIPMDNSYRQRVAAAHDSQKRWIENQPIRRGGRKRPGGHHRGRIRKRRC